MYSKQRQACQEDSDCPVVSISLGATRESGPQARGKLFGLETNKFSESDAARMQNAVLKF